MRALATVPGTRSPAAPPGPPPVEYGEAARRYLAAAPLGPASRRVYGISLAAWAWPLVGRAAPVGVARRRAAPPLVPLARLDSPGTPATLSATLTARAAVAGARTLNREVSALRSAVAWWREQGWLRADPTSGMRHLPGTPPPLPPLTHAQVTRLLRGAACLRDHAFWRVLHDTGATAEEILDLDIGRLDLDRHRARLRPGPAGAVWIGWREDTTPLLHWLVAGRVSGPVFLTDRRAPAGSDPAHVCPVTGRGRMSYRRAAEIFARATRPLDPSGKGWSLQQLRHGGTPGGQVAGRRQDRPDLSATKDPHPGVM